MKLFSKQLGLAATVGLMISGEALSPVQAQVPLTAYADRNGFINMQALTCQQLANMSQVDANYLTAWYGGWYDGLAQKHFAHITRMVAGEKKLILYCQANPALRIIEAIEVLLKEAAPPRPAVTSNLVVPQPQGPSAVSCDSWARNYAHQHSARGQILGGGAFGSLLGLGIGAATGGAGLALGAAIGGSAGLVGGGAARSRASEQIYNAAYQDCMNGRTP